MLCEEEYVLDKGICKKEVVVDDDDNVPVNRPEGDNNNNSNKEEKVSATLVYLAGLLTGCLLSTAYIIQFSFRLDATL